MSNTTKSDGHGAVIAILYIALWGLIAYRILRTLDRVFSKAPKVKKEKPFAIDTKHGILKGIHSFITDSNKTSSKKDEE